MWTLFKRECEDIWVYLLVAVLLVGSLIALTEFMMTGSNGQPDGIIVIFILGYILLCILLLAVGANRMVFDRANGISAFYAGHLTTRGRFFIVRLLLGALFVVLFYIPLGYWFIWRFLQLPDTWWLIEDEPVRKLACVMFSGFLFLLGCYNLGLRMGLYNKKIIYILGTACLGAIFLSLIVPKGFGFNAMIIPVVLIAAMIYSTWRDYSAIAL